MKAWRNIQQGMEEGETTGKRKTNNYNCSTGQQDRRL
jgi:hypothetical protein